ncbi:MAG: universal stress protein [Sediminibacterium sp.]|nr:universal stress protein [Sediminibacterium sp.]
METILLPTDFSPTAKNAAMYALKLAEQLGVKKLVLYHSYEIPITIDPLTPGVQMLDLETSKESSAQALENFEMKIRAFANNITIERINEYGALAEGLDDVCAKVNAGLIVMGITGGGALEEKLIGSNTISVAKHTKVPVIIVPSKVQFTRIESIMLTSDFDKADKTIPVGVVRKIVEETKAQLHVLHMEETDDEYGVTYPSNVMGESYALYSLLEDLNPEYHFSRNRSFVEACNEFVIAKGIDLVINVSKKHGFFERLFKESHTKMLAFHSSVPLMVINGQE